MNRNVIRIKGLEVTMKIDGEIQYGELSPKCHRNLLDSRFDESFPILTERKKKWIDYAGYVSDLWMNDLISDEKKDQLRSILFEHAFEIDRGEVTDEIQELLSFIEEAIENYL